jgi:dUTP pyrophosphatase
VTKGERVVSIVIEIERLPHGVGLPLPARATEAAAGFDLAAAVEHELWLPPGARRLVPTGFKVAIPAGYEGQVRPRSGLALRHGITLPNAPGTIDADYRGELMVILVNLSERPFRIRRGERIAQLVIAPLARAGAVEVVAVGPTARGGGGFGSTGR